MRDSRAFRFMFGFVSLLALGLMVAVTLNYVATGVSQKPFGTTIGGQHISLDVGSLMLGLALGLMMATLARIRWTDVPRSIISWFIVNERWLHRVAMAFILLGVLIFY
jgi:hypothetical protein